VNRSEEDLSAFLLLAKALEPYLEHLVFVGGWAHRLFARRPEARSLSFSLLTTEDADIVVHPSLPSTLPPISDLLKSHGFEAEMFGTESPPVTHYVLGRPETPSAFYAEFLSPLTGSEYSRSGASRSTATRAGVSLQQMRNVDLLLVNPWTVYLSANDPKCTVRIANAMAFLAQKLLIHANSKVKNRSPREILYIHDTLLMFSDRLDLLLSEWPAIEACLKPRQQRNIEEAYGAMFGRVTDDIRQAAEIAKGTARPNPPSPAEILAVCQAGLARFPFAKRMGVG
jgi:hypothetical protein